MCGFRIAGAGLAGLLFVSCAGVRTRAFSQERGFDTTTAACVANPLNCTAATGVVLEGGLLPTTASAGLLATVIALNALEPTTRDKVDAVVKYCADMARAEVLIRELRGRSPTAEQCREKVSLPDG